MGWMNQKHERQDRLGQNSIDGRLNDLKHATLPSASFIEDTSDPRSYQAVPVRTLDADLPFIDPSIILASKFAKLLWLVIDNVVYDCTAFTSEHPGGCKRFHGRKEMMEFGKPLRIDYTTGIQNKYKERPRFVGLRKLWADE
ncbi:hypothetical protein EDB80DRAFT_839369 [Ilyonectria destructans]|nr:hypothetical protein EDB80DRAFT_839369 [Ilyonectria destructans]